MKDWRKGYTLKVTEEKKLNSILCLCKISDGDSSITYGNMYFVCDLNKNVIQHFSWLEEYHEQLTELGYNLDLNKRERVIDYFINNEDEDELLFKLGETEYWRGMVKDLNKNYKVIFNALSDKYSDEDIDYMFNYLF